MEELPSNCNQKNKLDCNQQTLILFHHSRLYQIYKHYDQYYYACQNRMIPDRDLTFANLYQTKSKIAAIDFGLKKSSNQTWCFRLAQIGYYLFYGKMPSNPFSFTSQFPQSLKTLIYQLIDPKFQWANVIQQKYFQFDLLDSSIQDTPFKSNLRSSSPKHVTPKNEMTILKMNNNTSTATNYTTLQEWSKSMRFQKDNQSNQSSQKDRSLDTKIIKMGDSTFKNHFERIKKSLSPMRQIGNEMSPYKHSFVTANLEELYQKKKAKREMNVLCQKPKKNEIWQVSKFHRGSFRITRQSSQDEKNQNSFNNSIQHQSEQKKIDISLNDQIENPQKTNIGKRQTFGINRNSSSLDKEDKNWFSKRANSSKKESLNELVPPTQKQEQLIYKQDQGVQKIGFGSRKPSFKKQNSIEKQPQKKQTSIEIQGEFVQNIKTIGTREKFDYRRSFQGIESPKMIFNEKGIDTEFEKKIEEQKKQSSQGSKQDSAEVTQPNYYPTLLKRNHEEVKKVITSQQFKQQVQQSPPPREEKKKENDLLVDDLDDLSQYNVVKQQDQDICPKKEESSPKKEELQELQKSLKETIKEARYKKEVNLQQSYVQQVDDIQAIQDQVEQEEDKKSNNSNKSVKTKKKKKKQKKGGKQEEQFMNNEFAQFILVYEDQIKYEYEVNNQNRKYDIIGKTAAGCIKFFQASKNFWIIPLFIVFKRMMQLRKQIQVELENEKNIFEIKENFEKWVKDESYKKLVEKIDKENDLVYNELMTLLDLSQKMIEKLERNESKKIEKYINKDLQQDIKDIYFIYFYTQVFKTVRAQMEKEDSKKQIEHLKLQCGILGSIILSELQFCENDPSRFDLKTYTSTVTSNDIQLLELYIQQHENVVIDQKVRLQNKGIKI